MLMHGVSPHNQSEPIRDLQLEKSCVEGRAAKGISAALKEHGIQQEKQQQQEEEQEREEEEEER